MGNMDLTINIAIIHNAHCVRNGVMDNAVMSDMTLTINNAIIHNAVMKFPISPIPASNGNKLYLKVLFRYSKNQASLIASDPLTLTRLLRESSI